MSDVLCGANESAIHFAVRHCRSVLFYATHMPVEGQLPVAILQAAQAKKLPVVVASPIYLAKVFARKVEADDAFVVDDRIITAYIDRGLPFDSGVALLRLGLVLAGVSFAAEKELHESKIIAALSSRATRSSDGDGDDVQLDPFTTLGVAPGATLEDVKTARNARLLEYHPDRVNASGRKLRALATQETIRINQAFEHVANKLTDS